MSEDLQGALFAPARVASEGEIPREVPVPPAADLVRRTDPQTSRDAAATIGEHRTALQARVLEAFARRGPATARTAERWVEFADLGFSTVRKRISELAACGALVKVGVDRSGRAPATLYQARADRPGSVR